MEGEAVCWTCGLWGNRYYDTPPWIGGARRSGPSSWVELWVLGNCDGDFRRYERVTGSWLRGHAIGWRGGCIGRTKTRPHHLTMLAICLLSRRALLQRQPLLCMAKVKRTNDVIVPLKCKEGRRDTCILGKN